MRVLLYIDDYCYKSNGVYYAEEFCIILLRRYLAVFDYVTLAVRVKQVSDDFLNSSRIKYIPVNPQRVEVIDIPYGRGVNDFIRNFVKINRTLKASVKNFNLAIVRVPSVYSFSVLHYVAKRHLPYALEIVADCHDLSRTESSITSRLAWYLMDKLLKYYLFKALGIAYVTKEHLQQHYPPSKGVVTSSYSSIELPRDWYTSNRTFPKKKRFTIIHLAYHVFLNSSKGHKELLNVLAILKKKQICPNVVLVGNASQDDTKEILLYATEKDVEEQVSFAGFLNRQDLHTLLTEVDMAVLPTKSEGLPRVVIEAMAVGLPCVSTKVGGIPELLDDKFLLDMQDLQGFASVIDELMHNPDIYERTSKENYECSLQYEASVLNKKRNSFYTELKNKVINGNI